MNNFSIDKNRRILVIDDNRAIHEDFRKILAGGKTSIPADFDETEAALFGKTSAAIKPDGFEVDSAYQGQEALEMVRSAIREGRPYALAFVDVRMPPGWDGIETIAHLWKEDPDLQAVICTAYTDYSWDAMVATLGQSDRLLILKKPFDEVEVCQLACALSTKWDMTRQARLKLREVEQLVEARTQDIAKAHKELSELNKKLTAAQATAEAPAAPSPPSRPT
jgi:CheY-like chemotaxis protein